MPILRGSTSQALLMALMSLTLGLSGALGACTRSNCIPPDCFCAGLTGPVEIPVSDTPQIVLLSFDDAVLPKFQPLYEQLFNSGRRNNPNGCPITTTFYVTHDGTDYRMVNRLYAAGHEMASHSISHRLPQSNWTRAPYQQWLDEIGGQRDNLVKLGGVRFEDVRGMRSPFLETGGDEQYRMMAEAGFEYDSSFMVGPHDGGAAWPFTLDFPPTVPTYCSNLNCPRRPHPGVWQLPLNRWLGRSGRPCAMVDSCDSAAQPESGRLGDALAYFWHNFGRFYRTSRAPFGIHLHADWLLANPEYFEAFLRFVDTLLTDFGDVYFVTSHQAIEWMRQPRTIDEATSFQPWIRSCRMRKNRTEQHRDQRVIVPQQKTTVTSDDETAPNYKMQRPPDTSDLSGHLRPHYPEAYQVQRGVTKVTKTLDSSISVTSSTSTTTTKRVNQGTPSTTARPAILMRWNKLAINKPLIPTNRQLAVASKHGAASSKTMRSDTHNSASTISSHVVIMSAVLTGLAHLLN